MSAVLLIVSLVSACMAVAFGLVLITSWVINRAWYASTRQEREQNYVLQASIEVCNLVADREAADREYSIAMLDLEEQGEDCCDASRWTAADEDAYQRSHAREREIAASKRGDLLAAARFAEVAGG